MEITLTIKMAMGTAKSNRTSAVVMIKLFLSRHVPDLLMRRICYINNSYQNYRKINQTVEIVAHVKNAGGQLLLQKDERDLV
jgi:hypothetical protein